jgi:hypothetical protein
MAGTVDDYLPGYKKEITNILRRRMTLQDPKQAYSVRSANALGKLRMLLELKRDGRRKGRLIINKEPVEWQTGSNTSEVDLIVLSFWRGKQYCGSSLYLPETRHKCLTTRLNG